MQPTAKPNTLFCYICGRQFGTTSLSIHLKSCRKKFENEQSSKQPHLRISMPPAPQELDQILTGNLDPVLIQIYNQKAVTTHKYQVLPKCRFCERTFNQESLQAHEKGCTKKGTHSPAQDTPQLPDNLKKPRTLTCCICGRDFGLTSLKIHYPQCDQKFQNDEKLKPEADRKRPPQFSQPDLDMINSKDNWTIDEIEAFNSRAAANYRDNAMVVCQNCGRRFLEQSYQKHKKNCVLINGKNADTETKPQSKSSQLSCTSTQFKKPRTLQCCVCGRQFGMTSLKIHYPQCIEKFQNEEQKKPKGERKQAPKFSQAQLEMINNKQDWTLEEIAHFNSLANENYRDNAMVQCLNCGRKFLQQSYLKHKKNCQLINGVKSNSSLSKEPTEDKMRPNSPQFKKPRTLTCCVCGRDFGLTSLKIHYPQCLQKFKEDEKKKPKSERKLPASFSEDHLDMINNKTSWTLEEIDLFNQNSNELYRSKVMVQCPNCSRKFVEQSYLKHKKNCTLINGKRAGTSTDSKAPPQQNGLDLKKPKVLMCHVCGREFGLTSLSIHLPQCQQKFKNLQKKKVDQQPRPLPKFPDSEAENFNLSEASAWDVEKIEQYNKIANEVYRNESLCPCPQCGRKFFQQSLPKHLKHCQKNNDKKQSSQKRPNSRENQILNKSISKPSQVSPRKLGEDQEDRLKKIDQMQGKQAIHSTPQKQAGNESFLKKELYRKIQSSSNSNEGKIEGIVEADEELEQTIKKKDADPHQDTEGHQPSPFLSQEQANEELVSAEQNQQSARPAASEQKEFTQSEKQLSESTQTKNYQSVETIVSPKSVVSKGFAAPRKKQERNQASMKECKFCNRKFADDRIQKHQKICFESKQRQRKSQKNLPEPKTQKNEEIPDQKKQEESPQAAQFNERTVLSPDDKIRLKKGFAAPRQKESASEAQMSQCRGCKRKFTADRIQKHESICKKAQQQIKQPFVAGSYKKIDQSIEGERLSIIRVPCPKCNRKFAEERLQKHLQVCKSNSSVASSQQKYSRASKNQPEKPIDVQSQGKEVQSVNLEPCGKCGRKFNPDRIEKHQQICKGNQQAKSEPPQLSTAFKKQNSIKEVQIEPDLTRNVGEQTDERVQCQKCCRKFLPDRLQKHMNACKAGPRQVADIKNKINPKLQLRALKEKPDLKFEVSSAKAEESMMQTVGQDQYVENELETCIKCSRKFLKERLGKHIEFCKGERVKPQAARLAKNATQMRRQKLVKEEEIRKTKNQFFHMMKDLKCKKIKDQQIEKQLDQELLEIQTTSKMSRKENVNASNSERKRKKQAVGNKSIVLPKIC